ncbi:MAG: zinc metallopeptidase [Defluviitaleaceae bacterium]|nr:zinc metallopeptidase [Defluviitaleaceae bacterium]
MFFDTWGLFLLLPAMLLALYAQARVSSAMSRFSHMATRKDMRGADVAAAILAYNRIDDVEIERLNAPGGDHYDPASKTIRLSAHVYDSSSVTAVAVAAHEAGHAIQHSESYTPLALRNGIFPVVRLTSGAAFPLIIIGFLLGAGSQFATILIDVGIIFFAATVVFHLITLPVEYNASSRAREALEIGSYLDDDELQGARKVLGAAAMTYVAAAAVSIAHLLRFMLMRRR